MSATVLLRIHGKVARPQDFSLAQLSAVAAEFQLADMSLIDSRRDGRAVKLAGLLELVGPLDGADRLKLVASADSYEASIPLEPVKDRGLIIYCNAVGEQLDSAAGGPTRFYIQDHTACNVSELDACANVKLLDCIEVL